MNMGIAEALLLTQPINPNHIQAEKKITLIGTILVGNLQEPINDRIEWENHPNYSNTEQPLRSGGSIIDYQHHLPILC
jgi:hypothetical protein